MGRDTSLRSWRSEEFSEDILRCPCRHFGKQQTSNLQRVLVGSYFALEDGDIIAAQYFHLFDSKIILEAITR